MYAIHGLVPVLGANYNLYDIIVIPFVVIFVLCISNSELLNKLGSKFPVKYISSLGLLIYLCQEIGIHIIALGIIRDENIINNLPYVFFFITIVSAIIMHEAIERPVQRYLKSILAKSK